ncbi:hypothetical protein H310_02637 [Aphanomyces invadans]|uniref:Uncharacterized protein n=1 Tax=Aphanomyces invadans TaxID=157072 RepID=A0A024UKI1_9STRA|nr:hypothetical protein H310_02637 [Aphanomyces invadans]ETW06357.1 hypothetical protein H310_02637 [Aphanomyces invadans]|eukprot:XP_008864432.1 hypothetical protein H310_02637 [Aphanomyces invadans]
MPSGASSRMHTRMTAAKPQATRLQRWQLVLHLDLTSAFITPHGKMDTSRFQFVSQKRPALNLRIKRQLATGESTGTTGIPSRRGALGTSGRPWRALSHKTPLGRHQSPQNSLENFRAKPLDRDVIPLTPTELRHSLAKRSWPSSSSRRVYRRRGRAEGQWHVYNQSTWMACLVALGSCVVWSARQVMKCILSSLRRHG